MGLFNKLLGKSLPVNREELLAICENKISSGDYRGAALIAQEYKNRVIASNALSEKQKALDMAYSYYLIGKSVFKIINTHPNNRSYDHFKSFCAAFSIGCWYFQQILMNDECEWDESSEHFPFYDQLTKYYHDLYETYGENPDLDRADTDANEEISIARRGY
jgi:hypothetical protein